MKKLTALILAVIMVLSFASCGGSDKAKAEEIIARAEELGRTKGDYEFSSSNHIKQIFVIVPTEKGTFIDNFETNIGTFEYYSDSTIVSSIEGLVVYSTSNDITNNGFGSVSYLPRYMLEDISEEAEGEPEDESEEGSETPEGEFQFNQFPIFSAVTTAAPETDPLSMIEYYGTKYYFNDEKGDESKLGLSGLKWLYASRSLEFDNWIADKGETFSEVITAGDAVKDAAGEDYIFNADYINHCSSDKQYGEYESMRLRLEYFKRVIDALEAIDTTGMDEDEINAAYNAEVEKFTKANELEHAVRSLYNERAAYSKQLSALEPTALAELEALNAEIEEIKKDNANYKDDDRYWKIKLSNTTIGQYEDLLESIALLDRSIDTLYALEAETDYSLRNYLEDYSEDDQDLYVDYYQSRAANITAVMNHEKYLTEHASEIEEYNTAVDAVKAKYTDDSYKTEVEYMKLEIKYESLINDIAALENNVTAAKAASDAISVKREELKKEYEADVAARELTIKMNRDTEKIRTYFETYEADLKPLQSDGPGENSEIVLEKDGFAVVSLSSSIVKEVDDARNVKSSSGGGSGGRTCAEPGCTRKAAYSGDTIYCTTHSAKCLSCGCYIDKDAMYCMDCLRKALS